MADHPLWFDVLAFFLDACLQGWVIAFLLLAFGGLLINPN